MMKMSIKKEWNANIVKNTFKTKVRQTINDCTEHVLGRANLKYTPLDEGTLSRSGNTSFEMSADGGKARGSVYFDTKYAVRLHEHPEYRFQNNRSGKYLEKTVQEEQDVIRRKMSSINL